MKTGKAVIAQGGGPTAVINQSLVAAINTLRKTCDVDRIYGAIHGVQGVVREEFVDLTNVSPQLLTRIATTTGSALGSTRDKPDHSYCQQMFESLQAHDVRRFYYIGGNDSADTCRIIAEQASYVGYDLQVMHIPKTVDNDLLVSDHTPGFGSAAKFVAHAFAGAEMDNRSLPGIYLGVVMGRDAGFLTAASALSNTDHRDSPLLIYLPEFAFDTDLFLSQVESAYARFGRCMIAVSEGIRFGDGIPVLAKLHDGLERDPHGNYQLSGNGLLADSLGAMLKSQIKAKVRADTFGYIQRSFAGAISSVDATEAYAVAETAVLFSQQTDFHSGSTAIIRTGDYAVSYQLTSLESVARATRTMDPDWYDPVYAKITDSFFRYAMPLIDELPHSAILTGEPVEPRLRKTGVR